MAIVKFLEKAEGERQKLALKNPATLEHLYDIDCQTPEEVDATVVKARSAQSAWAALSIQERVNYMFKLRDLILERQDEIIDVVVRETGKTRQDALTFEIYAVASFISYWCKQAPKTLSEETVRAPGLMGLMKKVHINYKPLGVVGVIAPWNGPFVLTANPVIQAMLAGNAVVAKGSEVTPFCSKILEDLCRDAGIPDGVCNILMGDGLTGAALTRSSVNKVSFTGSTATGKKVASACIENLTPFSLELGGKDAMIVCNDANLDEAVHGAVWGSCVNTGHFCCSTERVYVEAGIYDEFVKKSTEMMQSLRQGQSHGVNEDVGAVFWDNQLEIIKAHVEDAKSKGGKVLVGGKCNESLKGLYYEPTLMIDVPEDSDLIQQETFGPVMPVTKVRDVEEAIQLANASNYGLHGSVWTKDADKGLAIARRVETGSMSVNDMGMMYGVANAPFGGVKDSGVGSVNGANGLRAYVHAMPIIVGRYGGEDAGYPHDEKKYTQMQKVMNFLWRNPVGRFLFGP